MKFRLYPFQKKAIENLLEFTANNKDMGWYLVKSPTGSGKTYIGLIFLYEMFLKKPSSNYHFYCWTRVGSHQINKVLNELIKLDEVSREFAQQLKISLIHNFESIELISDNKIVAVVDEAHHLTEEGAHRNKLIKSPNIQYLIGLTGTPRTTFENDGFSKCYIIERSDMFISLPLMVQITINLPSAESIKKEFGIGQKHIDNTKEVSDLLDNISSSGLTKESKSAYKIKFVASTISKQKNLGKTIVFTRLVAEAEMLSKELTKYGFRVLQINGDISDSHLQIYLHQFKISNDLILIGDKMINESLDIPMINTIILVDQTGSDMLYSQWLGRGSRISKDARRSFFNLIDFRENFDTHNEKEINGGFYNGSRGRKYFRTEEYFVGKKIYKYKPDIDLKLLIELIKDQNEYFGIDLASPRSILSEGEIATYLLLLCMPPKNNKYRLSGLEPFYQLLESTYNMEDIQKILLNCDKTKPLEVPFVKYFVKPIVDYIYGSSLIEESLESKDRIDLLILGEPRIIIEFAVGKADEKYDQILRYHHQLSLKNEKSKFQNIIVGTSYNGDPVSRILDDRYKVEFLNWFDFFNELTKKLNLEVENKAA